MYHMTKKKYLVAVVDVHHGDTYSRRYLKLFSFDFPEKIGIHDVSHDKKKY